MKSRFFNSANHLSKAYVYIIVLLLAGISTALLLRSDVFSIFPLKLTNVEGGSFNESSKIYYDMTGDGQSEIFRFTRYSENDVVECFDENENYLDVIRAEGQFLNNTPSYIFGDMDKDGYAELYLFTFRRDSIFLNGYETEGNDGHFLKNFFIDSFQASGKENDLSLSSIRIDDLDEDGYEELVFIIRAGYSRSIRKVYSMNPLKRILRSTQQSGAAFRALSTGKIPGVEGKVVVASSNAIQNYGVEDKVLFNDNSGWIIAYNQDLSETLLEKEYSHNKPYLISTLLETADGPRIFVMVYEYEIGRLSMERLNLDGKVEKTIFLFKGQDKYQLLNYYNSKLEHILVSRKDTILLLNNDLEIIGRRVDVGEHKMANKNLREQLNKGFDFLIFGNDNRVILFDSAARVMASAEVPDLYKHQFYDISIKQYKTERDNTLCMSQINTAILLRVQENVLFKFKNVVYLMVFFGFALFFLFVFRIQNYFYNRRFVFQSKVMALQLQSVQNQLQPHFTFNVLNTIGSMIYKNEKDQAYEYLNYFSDMLRTTLLSSNKSSWEIGEELKFIGAYMSMENLRFDNRFKFVQEIEVGTDLNIQVPRLAVQAFVENAVRHGLMHKRSDCCLWLIISQQKDHLKVLIEDNGIGRAAAENIVRHQIGLGNAILKDYMDIYNRTNKTKFIFTIDDLTKDDGSAAGTRVTLLIPNDFGSKSQYLWKN